MFSGPPSEPRTWHYGLVARWWAEFHHGGPEIEFLRDPMPGTNTVVFLARRPT